MPTVPRFISLLAIVINVTACSLTGPYTPGGSAPGQPPPPEEQLAPTPPAEPSTAQPPGESELPVPCINDPHAKPQSVYRVRVIFDPRFTELGTPRCSNKNMYCDVKVSVRYESGKHTKWARVVVFGYRHHLVYPANEEPRREISLACVRRASGEYEWDTVPTHDTP